VPPANRIEKKRQTRLRGLAGRCAETLLLRGRQKNVLTTATLAQDADVSAAMASYVLQRLAREDIVVAHGTGRKDRTWELLNRALLLDLWKTEERLTQARVTTAYVWASTFIELLSRLTTFNQRGRPWAIGGSAAANLYAPTLTVEPVLKLWISEREPVEEALESVHGKPVTGGHNVEVYQLRDDPWALHATALLRPRAEKSAKLPWSVVDQTTTDPAALRLVSRPRAYVETCYEATRRDMEVAEALRREMHLEDI
jgi:hypothetical protein